MAGLLAPLPVKNCWTIAEHAGDISPGGMQDLISRARWDDALVRADVRDFVAARLGHPNGVLLIETGDLKEGAHTVGVQRRYCGTAGKIENCQLAVHLSYASPFGHTLVDVALYLPKSWTGRVARGCVRSGSRCRCGNAGSRPGWPPQPRVRRHAQSRMSSWRQTARSPA